MAGNKYGLLIQKAVTTLQCSQYKRPKRVTRSCLRLMHQFLLLLTYHLYIRLMLYIPLPRVWLKAFKKWLSLPSFFHRKLQDIISIAPWTRIRYFPEFKIVLRFGVGFCPARQNFINVAGHFLLVTRHLYVWTFASWHHISWNQGLRQ